MPRAGMAPRPGVVARACAILAAASTNETTPEVNEPNKEDGCTLVSSARIVSNCVSWNFDGVFQIVKIAVDLTKSSSHQWVSGQ